MTPLKNGIRLTVKGVGSPPPLFSLSGKQIAFVWYDDKKNFIGGSHRYYS
jgi:hypothetical protein